MRSFYDLFRSWIQLLQAAVLRRLRGQPRLPDTSPAWRSLYIAAVVEPDRARVRQRIADARTALIQRARELFQTRGDHLQEESAIDDALVALSALERCVLHL